MEGKMPIKKEVIIGDCRLILGEVIRGGVSHARHESLVVSSQGGYLPYPHLCDEQSHAYLTSCQDIFPSQHDAHACYSVCHAPRMLKLHTHLHRVIFHPCSVGVRFQLTFVPPFLSIRSFLQDLVSKSESKLVALFRSRKHITNDGHAPFGQRTQLQQAYQTSDLLNRVSGNNVHF